MSLIKSKGLETDVCTVRLYSVHWVCTVFSSTPMGQRPLQFACSFFLEQYVIWWEKQQSMGFVLLLNTELWWCRLCISAIGMDVGRLGLRPPLLRKKTKLLSVRTWLTISMRDQKWFVISVGPIHPLVDIRGIKEVLCNIFQCVFTSMRT